MSWRKSLLWIASLAVLAFLLLPVVVTIVNSFATSSVLSFPPKGLTLHWYRAIPSEYFSALQVSLEAAAFTALIAVMLGVPAALAVVRGKFVGSAVINMLCLSPLTVPTLVIGVAAFQFLERVSGFVGWSVLGTIPGVVMGQTAFAIPFVIRAVITSQAHFDQSVEEAATSLGARPTRAFFTVTLPLLMPGVISGALFALIASLDDVPVALFVGGGPATTLPVKIFTAIEFSIDPTVMAISSILVLISIIPMLALDYFLGLDKFFGISKS